jgi:hypothetical protein
MSLQPGGTDYHSLISLVRMVFNQISKLKTAEIYEDEIWGRFDMVDHT